MSEFMPALQIAQMIVTFVTAFALFYVVRLDKTPLTISLSATVFCAFMVNVGYFLVFLSKDVRAAMNAIRIEYIGSTVAQGQNP